MSCSQRSAGDFAKREHSSRLYHKAASGGDGRAPNMMASMRASQLLRSCLLLYAALLAAEDTVAAPVSQVELRIVIGAEELTSGSDLELRIYEANGIVRRLPVSHAEPWLPDSTHLIPLKLSEGLEPRNVSRFAIYYRPGSALSAPFEIIAAAVELPSSSGEPQRLLGITLSGVIAHQGELATEDRSQAAVTCLTDADCDDGRTCNGRERCAPHSAGADARGCVRGTPVACHGLAPAKP